ncbi:MAG: PAS domain S-box protein [Desulfobulbus sp.]|nr:PAS domain S-box protein [Desulfobulbus sp.]
MAVRDITERVYAEAVMAVRMRLLKSAATLPLDSLLQATLDEAEILTGSQISFYHVMHPDQKTMSLQCWSTNTLTHLCKAPRQGLHYSVDRAGVWADAIRQRQAVIHNDFSRIPQQKGLPEGHVEVTRELLVPILREESVVGLIGLGNKPSDYDERDLQDVTILADLAWDIAQRKRAEMDLLEQKEQYHLLFESASDALLYLNAETGQILQANQQALELYGYNQQQLLAMDVSELAADRDESRQLLMTIDKRSKTYFFIPLRLHRKIDGFFFPAEITGRFVPYKDGTKLLLAVRDISKRVATEMALRASEHQLQEHAENLLSISQALDSVGLIVCELFEDDARIKVFNIGAEKLFGYKCEEVVGKSAGMIYPPENLSFMPERVRELSMGKTMRSLDVTLVRRSGKRFPAVVSIHPFSWSEGRCSKVVGIVQDISELMQAQTQLEAINMNLERRVEERTRELQETQRQYIHAEKFSALGKLSASIAHEFNNPLHAILVILKGLQKRAILEPEDKQLLKAAIGEGERIRSLIRSLQEFNRPSAGKTSLVDVHHALDSILLLCKSDFKKKRITVERHYAKDFPRIVAISDQIKQVFLNLFNNAADACQSQRKSRITITTREEQDMVAIAIADTGCGIEPENLESIFEPFYTTKAAVKGTGLGLPVCHGIITNHGGTITVESHPGAGTTFTLRLPIQGNAMDRQVARAGEFHG